MNVALIAIASNEAAYIAEFVFHHLQLGFAPIIVLVNNSDDPTAEILRMIGNHFPVVCVADDGSLGPAETRAFQRGAYQRMHTEHCTGADFIAVQDIDELWVPGAGTANVQAHLEEAGFPDVSYSNWFIPDNDDEPFSLALENDLHGSYGILLKSIWRSTLPLAFIQPHTPAVRKDVTPRVHIPGGATLDASLCRTELPR